jgi:hypothetical protein
MLDEVDLGRAFPSMTILRLRADRNATMVMRWVRTTTYEEWRIAPQLEATHQISEEQTATTLKTIVELDEATDPRHQAHYLMVMEPRDTVRYKRGISCYRPRTGIARNKESGWYERRQLKVATDNAALPSGLEVTVLQAPNDVVPDILAHLVMGLRLGYAHYDDWTALPAPLFFVAKVRDYIIRYPELLEHIGDGAPEGLVGLGEGRGPEVDVGASAQLRSELVAEVLQGLPGLAAETTSKNEIAGAEEQAGDAQVDTVMHAKASEDEEQEEDLPDSLEDPILDRAFKAARAAPALYSQRSGPFGR